ncbi:hypothetical protein [Glutamicibacter soli]|uniref:hypothetical protein n=1 Tax=Glutamicibacter soli TaxID=453836 RepID=UPI003FD3384A
MEFEIFDTPTRHRQFKRAAEVWPRFPDRFKQIISDEPTDELRGCCLSVFGMEFDELYATRADRGENMAILHGVLLARKGNHVVLVCDEEAGTAKITQQAKVLAMQHVQGRHVPGGKIQHASTLTLLRWAIESNAFKSKDEFIRKYRAMSGLDSALPRDVKSTGLTGSPPWPPAQT